MKSFLLIATVLSVSIASADTYLCNVVKPREKFRLSLLITDLAPGLKQVKVVDRFQDFKTLSSHKVKLHGQKDDAMTYVDSGVHLRLLQSANSAELTISEKNQRTYYEARGCQRM